jgi:hypothetical protein
MSESGNTADMDKRSDCQNDTKRKQDGGLQKVGDHDGPEAAENAVGKTRLFIDPIGRSHLRQCPG